MSVASILSGTPASITVGSAAVSNNVINSTSSLDITQSSANALLGISIVSNGGAGIDIQQNFAGAGAGIQMNAQGDAGIVLNAPASTVDLIGQTDINLTSASGAVSLTATLGNVNLTAGADMLLSAGTNMTVTGAPLTVSSSSINLEPAGIAGITISTLAANGPVNVTAGGAIDFTGPSIRFQNGDIGFFTAPAVPQQTQAVGLASAGIAGTGAPVLDDTTFGNGANKYSLPQVIAALQLYGILA